jgi:hypothetical protein
MWLQKSWIILFISMYQLEQFTCIQQEDEEEEEEKEEGKEEDKEDSTLEVPSDNYQSDE